MSIGNWISTIEIQVQNQNPYSFLLQQNKELQRAQNRIKKKHKVPIKNMFKKCVPKSVPLKNYN
jgi:hypothetical protein